MKLKYTLLLPLLCMLDAHAGEPADYYSSCENKGGKNLLSALHETVGPHTTISYDGLLDLYKTSDVYPDGKIWDMYSTKHWSAGSTCGNYKLVGDCYNREHSFPKSWFNDAKPMYSDAFHLYPTDGKVNGQRSNFPYGECANGTRLASNNGVQALGRLGRCTFPGYSGTVFEPDDEYKGDFARSYFYMAAAYNDRIASWSSDMLAGNSYPAFSAWSVELLLKWHRQDPVSEKEIQRNDVVYSRQRNRNPFIDHPEMAEYIWGNKKDSQWSYNITADPEINSPVDGSTVDLGTAALGRPRTVSVTVKASNLANPITVTTSGDFYAAVASIPAASACSGTGYDLDVTFNATHTGNATGSMVLKSGDISCNVNLEAEAVDGLPAGRPADITDCGFTATWTYIGDADPQGHYFLFITEPVDDEPLPGYPLTVDAAAGKYEVTGLEAETEYGYFMRSASLASPVYHFTTASPVPSIDFYFDGDLYLKSMPGEPGEEAEIEAEIENISGDIMLSVTAPFEISTDHSSWGTSAVLPEGADRLYIRLYGDTPGEYSTSLVARAGDYFNDNAVINGMIGSVTSFFEDFEAEDGNQGTYSNHSYNGTACLWNFKDAGMWSSDQAHGGDMAVRMGKTADSSIEMAEDVKGGIGTVSLWAKTFGDDQSASFSLEYSSDGGDNWNMAGSASTSAQYQEFTFTVNQGGNVRLRIRQTEGKRWNLDDVSATAYHSSATADDIDGYHRWDAWCEDGSLVVKLSDAAQILVYGTDGIIYANGMAAAGTNSFDLAPGLYLVAVNGRVRRVAVR